PLHLQPKRESRAVWPGDRRLWTLRRGHSRAPQTAAAHQARAGRAHHRRRRSHAGLRRAHRGRLSLRRLPIFHRRQFGHIPAQGVFACYRPLPADAPMPAQQKELGETQWRELYRHSHADTQRAYEAYTSYYLSTSGQRYWSDLSQLGVYIDDYHAELDRQL